MLNRSHNFSDAGADSKFWNRFLSRCLVMNICKWAFLITCCLSVCPSVCKLTFRISHNWVFQIQGKNPVTEIVQMADSCQKGTLIVWITPSFYTLVFKIESCSFADQLYIYQRCAYYLDFEFWLPVLMKTIHLLNLVIFWQNVAYIVPHFSG